MTKPINAIKRGPLANCIALHDLDGSTKDLKEFLDYIFHFFRKHGIEPTRMSSQKTDKTVSIRMGIKQWKDMDYKGVKDMVVYATPAHHNSDMFDSIFISSTDFTTGKTTVLCFDDQILGFKDEIIHILVRDLSTLLSAHYGYGYQRRFAQGPTFYAFGAIGGNEEISDHEEHQIMCWNNTYRMPDGIYTLGDLRDIYPYNFLSTPHLERDIFGQPLRQWIESDSSRGKLTPLTDTLWSWHVTPDQISPVRNALVPTGIILCP